jgi:hypothetical protein
MPVIAALALAGKQQRQREADYFSTKLQEGAADSALRYAYGQGGSIFR